MSKVRLNYEKCKKMQKKVWKNLRNKEKYITFAPAKPQKVCPLLVFGALDERFSLRSAKPTRAVRLRHAPQRKGTLKRVPFLFIYVPQIWQKAQIFF